eukprot:gene3515-6162_t
MSRARSRSQAELKTRMTQIYRDKKHHKITAELSLQKLHFREKEQILVTVEMINDSRFNYKLFKPNSVFESLYGFVVEKDEVQDVFEDKSYIELGKPNYDLNEEDENNYIDLEKGESVSITVDITEIDPKFFDKGDYNIHCIRHQVYHSDEKFMLGPLGQKIKIKCRPMKFKVY